MSAPFCTGCGATIAAGTRFCVKCGQPVGLAAPPRPAVQPAAPPTIPLGQAPPPPPPPKMPSQFPAAQDPVGLYPPPPPPKQGAGAGLWVGLFGLLLIICGAGLWYGFHAGLLAGKGTKQVAVTSEAVPAPVPVPAPSTTPEAPPPNPDFAKKEEPPPNPDFAKKMPQPATDVPVRNAPAKPRPVNPAPASPQPRPAPKAASPTTGVLHAAVEVAQNGEVVFENLPAGRMRFTYDHSAWQPTIHRQTNGTQTLVMRSLKPGIQRVCDVQWEIVAQ
jgi:hypothetical protein